MRVCILGEGLVSLTLAKALINQGIYVDYLSDQNDDYSQNFYSTNEENNNFQTKSSPSFHQYLDNQSRNLILSDKEKPLCEFLIGSIDESGYLRREIDDIIDDLAFTQNIITTKNDILSLVWNYSSDSDTHTVETHIYRLRKKIADNFDFTLNN